MRYVSPLQAGNGTITRMAEETRLVETVSSDERLSGPVFSKPLSHTVRACVASILVCIAMCAVGAQLLADRRPGCPNDRHDQACIDTSTYSPHAVAAWLLIAAGACVVAMTFYAARARVRRL